MMLENASRKMENLSGKSLCSTVLIIRYGYPDKNELKFTIVTIINWPIYYSLSIVYSSILQ